MRGTWRVRLNCVYPTSSTPHMKLLCVVMGKKVAVHHDMICETQAWPSYTSKKKTTSMDYHHHDKVSIIKAWWGDIGMESEVGKCETRWSRVVCKLLCRQHRKVAKKSRANWFFWLAALGIEHTFVSLIIKTYLRFFESPLSKKVVL